jgi:hypothetical protein
MNEGLHAVWEGTFSIGGAELKVYVLNDGQRVMDADSFAALFDEAFEATSEELAALTEFMRLSGPPYAESP